jgi:excisionase family DNA binding protein
VRLHQTAARAVGSMAGGAATAEVLRRRRAALMTAVDDVGAGRLLTPEDLAELLGVDRETIYRMARRGELPAIKVARHWRFRAERIERWVCELEGEAPDDRDGR